MSERIDIWQDHFKIERAVIKPISPIGKVTERIFQFNIPTRLAERNILRELDLFPHPDHPSLYGCVFD